MATGNDPQAAVVRRRVVEVDGHDHQIEVRVGERRKVLVPVEPGPRRARLEHQPRLLQLDVGADQVLHHVEDPRMEDQVVEAPVVRDRITHPRDVVRPVSAPHHEKLPCAVSETPGGAQERGQRGAQPGELPGRQEILKDQIAAPKSKSRLCAAAPPTRRARRAAIAAMPSLATPRRAPPSAPSLPSARR